MKLAKFEFRLFGINTYVVYDPATRDCAIIDPGMSSEEEEHAMETFIERENLKVTHIIDTHLHVDHAIGANFTKKRFGAPLFAHRDDRIFGTHLKEQAARFHLREKVENVTIDSFLEDGDVVKIGNGLLHVLHVPGHSPGSIALYDKEGGFVISGDTIFAGSIGRTDLEGGNTRTLINAINDKLMSLPPSTVIYPGHGPATTVGIEMQNNPYLKMYSGK